LAAIASSAPDVAAAMAGLSPDGTTEVAIDAKLDGIRIQVHRDGDDVLVVTRSLDDITGRLPEVVEVARSLPAERFVLDGEALALSDDGRPMAFQDTASRTAQDSGVAVTPHFFDLLHVDARRTPAGPLVNAAVVSRAAPSYAPPGRHLVQGSALLRDGHDADAMRRHAGDLLGVDPSGWEVVARHEVPDALPAQPTPFSTARPVRHDDLVVCGDHRDTGSIQGALVSGQRAADAVLGAGAR
jgi:DNA ligase-1